MENRTEIAEFRKELPNQSQDQSLGEQLFFWRQTTVNGILQGSPLSVILFLISYNKLCPIEVHRGFKFFSYADDFTILKKIHKNVTMFINSLFTDIISWCDYSGAKLSVQKFKHLHICRKHRCNFTITSQAYCLNQANSLKILGLTISSR